MVVPLEANFAALIPTTENYVIERESTAKPPYHRACLKGRG